MSDRDLEAYLRREGNFRDEDYDRDFGYRSHPENSWGRGYDVAYYGGPYRSWGAGYGPPHAEGHGVTPGHTYQQGYEENDWSNRLWDRESRERRGYQFGDSNRRQDAGTWGRFSGRGPKNYQRSDERIREDISDGLTDHPQIDPSEIEVQVSNGEVTLQGTVDRRGDKRLAEDIAWGIRGVKEVHNRLKVANRHEIEWGEHRRSAA